MAKKKYEWSVPHYRDIDPQKVGVELDALRDREGVLDIHLALEWAEAHPKSELAKCIEWDDQEAAFKWRMHELRMVVAQIRRVEVSGGKVTLHRAHFSIGGGHFVSPEGLEADEEKQAAVLQRAIQSLQGWTERYSEVLELCGHGKAAERLLRALRDAA